SLIALYLLVLFMVPLPPSFTLFPYTTLFRSREQLRHLADLLGRDAGDGSCPFRRLRLAVVLALHIGDPAVGAGGVALHVFAILEPLIEHVMRHCQEEGDVGVGNDLHPLRIEVDVRGRPWRVDRDEATA